MWWARINAITNLSSHQCTKFLDQLWDYQILNKDAAEWSYYNIYTSESESMANVLKYDLILMSIEGIPKRINLLKNRDTSSISRFNIITFSLYKINLLVWATSLGDRLPKNLFWHFRRKKFTFSFFIWCNSPQWAKASAFTRFLDNAQWLSVGLLWTSDQSVAETSTWQHTTITTDKHPCPRRDSKPQSQRTSGRRPTP